MLMRYLQRSPVPDDEVHARGRGGSRTRGSVPFADRTVVGEDHVYAYVERPEVVPFIPAAARVVLDVGCSHGGFAVALRRTGRPLEVWGIDTDPMIQEEAAPRYDRFVLGQYPEALVELRAYFDCIVFNDVLEHMPDPWEVLRMTRRLLSPIGTVVASIPNVRYLPVSVRLLLNGDFSYADIGVMDRTHLRFFTMRSMRELFEASGYAVLAMEGINPWRERHWLAAIAPRHFADMFYRQFIIAARPRQD
jgi:2-polyprenyl-3-methyl-5-hydroxy-6-metoxy-1,4-benzoquinol methylase